MKFRITLQVAQQNPVIVEANSTEELRLAVMPAVEQAAPGWLATITDSAAFFYYSGDPDGSVWGGLPEPLREIHGGIAYVLVGFSVPGPNNGPFVTLCLEIGWISRIE